MLPRPQPDSSPITDPRTLRALAHPIRVQILELIALEGSVTATRCSEILGPSPAACSFHLRALAKYGFVEEAPGGVGRERPWRRTERPLTIAGDDADLDERDTAREAAQVFVQQEVARLLAWPQQLEKEPPDWRLASTMLGTIAYLTRAELDELVEDLQRVIDRHEHRLSDPAARPPGARPVRLLGVAVPLPQPPED